MTRIVVLQRGWVVVGKWQQDGPDVTLTGASVVRRWGTTKGLGQLAAEGPTKETVLDACPPVRFHELTVVLNMDATHASWGDLCG